jgi:ubiquinone/menaquinone biosynthesis C-methylase UbiE
MLQQAAEKLVRQRRARELEGGERWETFVGKHLHKRRGSSGLDVGSGKGTVVAS